MSTINLEAQTMGTVASISNNNVTTDWRDPLTPVKRAELDNPASAAKSVEHPQYSTEDSGENLSDASTVEAKVDQEVIDHERTDDAKASTVDAAIDSVLCGKVLETSISQETPRQTPAPSPVSDCSMSLESPRPVLCAVSTSCARPCNLFYSLG